MIAGWYLDRDMTPPAPESLSDVGYIVEERVAGWLYLTNSNVAMIEGIISDPLSLPSFRRLATKRLCGTLVDMAVALGYTKVLAITSHPAVVELAETMGFEELDKRVFILNEEDSNNDEVERELDKNSGN